MKDLTKSIELLKQNKKEIVEILFTLNGVYHSTNKIKSYQKFNVMHQRSDKINWVVEMKQERNSWNLIHIEWGVLFHYKI